MKKHKIKSLEFMVHEKFGIICYIVRFNGVVEYWSNDMLKRELNKRIGGSHNTV